MTDSQQNHPTTAQTRPAFSGGAVFEFGATRTMGRQEAQNEFLIAAAEEYKGEWDADTQSYTFPDPEWRGKTIQWVATRLMARKAMTGDLAALNSWMDRVLGKPKQSVETVSVGMSFMEYLDHLAATDEEQKNSAATPTYSYPVPNKPAMPHTVRVNIDDI